MTGRETGKEVPSDARRHRNDQGERRRSRGVAWIAGRRVAAVIVLVVIGFLAVRSAPLPAPPPREGPYGSAIGSDGLANTQIGGEDEVRSSFRFRATETAPLNTVRIYVVDGEGYSGGTGGSLSISVQPDDGAADHAPTGAVLATTTVTPGNPITIGYLPLITFPSPAKLTAGQLYHLVFANVDADPKVNFVSVNALWTDQVTRPRQPTIPDLDWAQLVESGNGWTVRPNFTPILDLGYGDGTHAGVGYMEVWVATAGSISGANAVREVFTPTADRVVSSASVRLRRLAGSGPLTIRLSEVDAATALAQADVPGGSIGTDPAWLTATLPTGVRLRAGVAYQLLLTAPTDTTWSTWAIERGSGYHFSPLTYFPDGYAQHTSGSGWSGFDQPGGTTDNRNADLQFVLR
jgi:hypothetical protein